MSDCIVCDVWHRAGHPDTQPTTAAPDYRGALERLVRECENYWSNPPDSIDAARALLNTSKEAEDG